VTAWITPVTGVAITRIVRSGGLAERVPVTREPDAALDKTGFGGDTSDRIVPPGSSAGGFEWVAAGTRGESRVV
jgi:hypothetical protein